MLACDFLTVETAFLQRIYVLFFISLATRRIEYLACTASPDGDWVAQQARNLVMQLGERQPFRFLVHDRDSKFSYAFDEVFRVLRPGGLFVITSPLNFRIHGYPDDYWRMTPNCLRRMLEPAEDYTPGERTPEPFPA